MQFKRREPEQEQPYADVEDSGEGGLEENIRRRKKHRKVSDRNKKRQH